MPGLRCRLFLQPKHGAFNNGSKTLFIVVLMGHFNLVQIFFPCLLFSLRLRLYSFFLFLVLFWFDSQANAGSKDN